MADNILNFAKEVGKDMAVVQNKTTQISATDDSRFRVRDEHGRVAFEVDERGDLVAGGVPVKTSDGWRIRDEHGRIAFEVDDHGRTHIHDPAFDLPGRGPVRSNLAAKFQPEEPVYATYYPTHMNPWDRTSMINHNSSTLRYSQDEGETWHSVREFESPVRSGIFLKNGEVIVAIKPNGYDDPFKLYLSKGWQDDPTTAEWSHVHTGATLGTYPSAAFSWSEYENMVFVSDYGPKLGQTGARDAARYVYMSRDYGKTWEIVFDLLTDAPGLEIDEGVHNHGVLYDPYWDRIWVTYGDDATGETDIVFSDDLGKTWHTVGLLYSTPSYQCVGMFALPGCVLFATDGAPNGVLRIDRAAGKHTGTYDMEVAYRHDDEPGLTILCQCIWKAARPGNDAPVVFEYVSAPGEGRRFILTTVDGHTFNKVWEGEIVRGNSSGSAYGPTASGRLLHYAVDEYFAPGGRTLRQGPMPNAY